ncbi:MAG TPA: ABC transporter transmembrane domain-containing protein, partial [Candidatus Limnocylindria bacterium]|nr:ABC transporter transmembrane domain-containing protein [Candidatus Limnocylindria bacterium]
MEPTFFKFIFKYSWRQQLFLLFLTAISFPFLYYSLELPKVIVNRAIGSTEFPIVIFERDISQIQYLLALCLLFLLLVVIRFGLRYWLNVLQGQLGERMLRRLRYELFSRILRFPLPVFRKKSQGEIIAMITSEVEPLGGFVGDVLALPAFQGGTLVTILVFMFMQDWILGLAAISLFPVQIYIIPKLQKQINALAKERVRTVRKMSERIGEVVSGIEDVHAHDTAELERADFSRWSGKIYAIRYKIYRKKVFVKFLNNFLSQLTPFFFFSIGGYLVITGELTFGALVAVLAAYKDVSAPWKELLGWYQQKEDSRIKYDQLYEQFMVPGMLDPKLQAIPQGDVPRLTGRAVVSNITFTDEHGVKVVDGASFTFDLRDKVALVGREGSGQSITAKLLARLLVPTAGNIKFGELDLATLPQHVTGRRIGYCGPAPSLFQGTVRDNLYYGLKHQPLAPAHYEGNALHDWEWFVREAKEAGNTTSDIAADWIEYRAIGADGQADGPDLLLDRTLNVLKLVGVDRDIFDFGLQTSFDPLARPELAASILRARDVLRDRLKERDNAGLVELFDRESYNRNMSVAENVLFGTPIGRAFDLNHIAENAYVLSVPDKAALTRRFLEVGLQVASLMVELFQDVQPGDELFARFSFISADVLPDYQALVRRAETTGLDRLSADDRRLLLSLPFMLVPARHRLGVFDDEMETRLLKARRIFAADLPEDLRPAVALFDPECYNAAASVQDNILFGRLVYGRPQSQRIVGTLIGDVVESLGLRRAIVELGLG